MIESMTGFGQHEKTEKGITISIEARSVNNRYLEIFLKAPQSLLQKENEIKELIRENFTRGKINFNIQLQQNGNDDLKINEEKAKQYFELLKKMKKTFKTSDKISLNHLLRFTDLFEQKNDEFGEKEWDLFFKTAKVAILNLKKMRQAEGNSLKNDLQKRITLIDKTLSKVEKLSQKNIESQKTKLKEKVKLILDDKSLINSQRIEMEILLLTDKLDVTEEVVRFKTHNKYFLRAMEEKESQGRKLNFLVQEMNREANTIGSKSSDAEIAHFVVAIKEEIEKIREQLQNIE